MELIPRKNTIKKNYYEGLWYIAAGYYKYLWKDLEFHQGTFNRLEKPLRDEAPGYYATKAEAERYLKAYEVKNMKFVIKWYPDGWIVLPTKKIDGEWYYLHKNLELHRGTVGYKCGMKFGKAPGYYHTENYAKMILRKFKEKHNMTQDNLEINVKLNGVSTPLHEISEQTLLNLREASKPKAVPALQVCDCNGRFGNGSQRLVLRVTLSLKRLVSAHKGGEFLYLDEDGNVRGHGITLEHANNDDNTMYTNFRELKLDEV